MRDGGRWMGDALLLLAADACVLVLALLGGDLVLHWTAGASVSLKYSLLVVPVWCVGALLAGLAPGWGLNAVAELRRVEQMLLLIFSVAAVVVFVSGMSSAASRGSYVVAYLIAAFGLPFARHGVRHAAARRGVWGIPVVIHGSGTLALAAAEALRLDPSIGYRPVASFGPEPVAGLPRLGGLEDAAASVSVAFLADADLQHDQLARLVDGPLSRYRTVVLMPGLLETPSLWAEPRDYHGLLGLEISNNLLDPRARVLKRAVELVLVLASMPLWLPLCLVLGVCVFLGDRRSPLYRQDRVGRGGRRFRVLKFRTMVPQAEQQLQERLAAEPALRAEWEARHKLRDDWRITPAGRFLRRWSLDEIPQMWNVIRGDMALVGPRPLPGYHLRTLSSAAQVLRERVQPGVTGLWQIRGRSELEADDLARWDSYYVRNWSIWLDLLILARTLRAVIRGRGAY